MPDDGCIGHGTKIVKNHQMHITVLNETLACVKNFSYESTTKKICNIFTQ